MTACTGQFLRRFFWVWYPSHGMDKSPGESCYMVSCFLISMAINTDFIYRHQKAIRVIICMWVMTSSETVMQCYSVNIFSFKFLPVMAFITEFGSITDKELGEIRWMGIMTADTVSLHHRRMCILSLEISFFVAFVTKIRQRIQEFHALIILRMLQIFYCHMACLTAWFQGRVYICFILLNILMAYKASILLGSEWIKWQKLKSC